jgi:hypothetical protein
MVYRQRRWRMTSALALRSALTRAAPRLEQQGDDSRSVTHWIAPAGLPYLPKGGADMNVEEQTLRDAVRDSLVEARIEMASVRVEVAGGQVRVGGTVPSPEQYSRLLDVVNRASLDALLRCDVHVAKVDPSG